MLTVFQCSCGNTLRWSSRDNSDSHDTAGVICVGAQLLQDEWARGIVSGFPNNTATSSGTINAVFDYGRVDLCWRLPCDIDIAGSSSDGYCRWICWKGVEEEWE